MLATSHAVPPTVGHVEYAPRTVLTSKKEAARPVKVKKKMEQTNRRTDARQMHFGA